MRNSSEGALMANDQSLEIKIAHLGLIQGVIARMAGDGQTMKTLAITIAAAIVALAPNGGNLAVWLALTGMLAVGVFWWQTSYHLHIERAYRCLYDQVREDAAVPPFTMDWRNYRDEVDSPQRLAFTSSVFVPFGGMIAVLFVLLLITIFGTEAKPLQGANTNGAVVRL